MNLPIERLVVPFLLIHEYSLTFQCCHLMLTDSHLLFCKLYVGRNGYIIDAIAAFDILTFETVDDRTALDGNLVLCLLDQWVCLYQSGAHIEVDVDDIPFLVFAGDGQVCWFAIYLYAIFVTPVGFVKDNFGECLGLLDSQCDFAVPGIVGDLFYLQVLGL